MHATAVKGPWDAVGRMIRAITVRICAVIACQRRSPLTSECRAAKYMPIGLCASDPARAAKQLVDRGFAERYDYTLQTLTDNPWQARLISSTVIFSPL